MTDLGVIVYRGPSLLTGDPIVAVVTGLGYPSRNPKTGAMLQVWILRPDLPPMDAKRQNVDDAVCGDCALRQCLSAAARAGAARARVPEHRGAAEGGSGGRTVKMNRRTDADF